MWKTATLSVAALSLGLTTIAVSRHTHHSGAARYEALGVVVTAAQEGRIRISHNDIPGYMPGMTMDFALEPEEGATLGPGDRVRFVAACGNRAKLDRGRADHRPRFGVRLETGYLESVNPSSERRRAPAAVACRSERPPADGS